MKLLNSVLITFPITGLRMGYAIAFLQLRISNPTSAVLTSRAIVVCLNVVPEMLIIAVFVCAGIKTRSLKQKIREQDYDRPQEQGHSLSKIANRRG